jgi:hypothetical protein
VGLLGSSKFKSKLEEQNKALIIASKNCQTSFIPRSVDCNMYVMSLRGVQWRRRRGPVEGGGERGGVQWRGGGWEEAGLC